MTLRAKEIIRVKRTLNLPQDVRGDKVQKVIPESIEGAKKARGDGGIFPAGWGKGGGGGGANVA